MCRLVSDSYCNRRRQGKIKIKRIEISQPNKFLFRILLSGMLCATFRSVPVVALTATASKSDVAAIKESLNLKHLLR